MLPKGKVNTRKVSLSGGEVEVRGLTIGQAQQCGDMTGTESIALALSFATGTEKADAVEWLDTAPAGDVTALLTAITDASGLGEGAQFPE